MSTKITRTISYHKYKPYLSKGDKKSDSLLSSLSGSVFRFALPWIILFDTVLVGWYTVGNYAIPKMYPGTSVWYPFSNEFWAGQMTIVLGLLVSGYIGTCVNKYFSGWAQYMAIGGSAKSLCSRMSSSFSKCDSSVEHFALLLVELCDLCKAFCYGIKHNFRDGGQRIDAAQLPITTEELRNYTIYSTHAAKTNNGNPMPSKGDVIMSFLTFSIAQRVRQLSIGNIISSEIEKQSIDTINSWESGIGNISLGGIIPDPKPYREVMFCILVPYLIILPCNMLTKYGFWEALIINTIFVFGLMGMVAIGPLISRVFDDPQTNPLVRNQRIGSQAHSFAAMIDMNLEHALSLKGFGLFDEGGRSLFYSETKDSHVHDDSLSQSSDDSSDDDSQSDMEAQKPSARERKSKSRKK